MARGWSAADMPDQTGRVAIVTGANSGLGLVDARELARSGAEVIMACRSLEKGEAEAEAISTAVAGAKVRVAELDLADLSSVREFAERVRSEQADGIDLLINNAGVMAPPRRETVDGFELQIGTNHLGHFALTGLLVPSLLKRDSPRVVTLSSGAHRIGRINFDDLHRERGYSRWGAYGQSKLANLIFALELQRRAASAGTGLKSMAAHPGYAATNLQSAGPGLGGELFFRVTAPLVTLTNIVIGQSAESGALPTLFAATRPDLLGGSYIGPGGPGELRGSPTLVGTSRAALAPETAERLWRLSEELTGVEYPF